MPTLQSWVVPPIEVGTILNSKLAVANFSEHVDSTLPVIFLKRGAVLVFLFDFFL